MSSIHHNSFMFGIGIVYALPCDSWEIESPAHGELKIRSVTVENSVVDKISACHQFGSGKPRLKDFDDLWRLSRSALGIHSSRVKKLAEERNILLNLDLSWLNLNSEKAWIRHAMRYRDLPDSLKITLDEINNWLLRF